MIATRLTVVLLCALLPLSLWAEASVGDATLASPTAAYSSEPYAELPLSQDNTESHSPKTSINPNNPASLLSKLNDIQTEIQQLRGKLEIQSHELERLKEQQLAYYNDLDQRITALSSGKKPSLSLDNNDVTPTPAATPAIAPIPTSSNPQKTNDEQSAYDSAYGLIEKKQFDDATVAMHDFVQHYPDGKFTSNAHYWLGELLLAKHQDQAAIKEFQIVVNQYPTSNKVAPAMLKLGFTYANLQETDKAKTQLLNVEHLYPNTEIARLAHQRLQSLH